MASHLIIFKWCGSRSSSSSSIAGRSSSSIAGERHSLRALKQWPRYLAWPRGPCSHIATPLTLRLRRHQHLYCLVNQLEMPFQFSLVDTAPTILGRRYWHTVRKPWPNATCCEKALDKRHLLPRYLAEKLVWPEITFNDLEGQNNIAYDTTVPNLSMHAKNQVNRCSG